LTPTEITETKETAEQQSELAHTHEHHHDHDHNNEHEHQHAPALNPELTREIEVEIDADEVSKTFKTVVKRYQKLARIPGFRAGKVPESLVFWRAWFQSASARRSTSRS
jgi:trigger factor